MATTKKGETPITPMRLAPETRRQLKELAERWGTSMTQVVARAVDRAYVRETEKMEVVRVKFGAESAEISWDPRHANAPVESDLDGISGTQTADYRHCTHILAIEAARCMGARIPSPFEGPSPRPLDAYDTLAADAPDWEDVSWEIA